MTLFAAALGGPTSVRAETPAPDDPADAVTLTPLGQYATDEGIAGSEIVAYDPATQRVFSTNGAGTAIDIIDIADPATPALVDSIDLTPYGTDVQSVAVGDAVIAVALDKNTVDFETDPLVPVRTRDNGAVAIFSTDGEFVDSYEVGSLPDMVTFTPDKTKVLVANEGEAVCEYSYVDNGDGLEIEMDGIDPVFTDVLVDDPEGSVSIVDIAKPSTDATAVQTAGFTAFNGHVDDLRADDVRIWTGPVWDPDNEEYTVAQDIEPEYVAVSDDGTTAYATLQENNAVAVIDIATATVSDIVGLGYKDHSTEGSGLDPTDDDATAVVGPQPVHGMYLPDTIDAASIGDETYLFTANEGDAREWPCTFPDDYRVGDFAGFVEPVEEDYDADESGLPLDPTEQAEFDAAHDDWEALVAAQPELADFDGFDPALGTDPAADANLGRLKTTFEFPTALNEANQIDTVYSLGARSFSIWSPAGEQVFDSGDQLERLLTTFEEGGFFNVNGEALTVDEEPLEIDNRSDDKGPEPEALAVGEVSARTYAFVGLERAGGVAVYDVSDPANATLATYTNTMVDDPAAPGDVAPEGITFIPARQSPTGEALIAVSYEMSGTVRLFQVDAPDGPLMEPMNPTRIADTRDKTSATVGTTYDGIGEGDGPVEPGTPLVVQVGGRAGVPMTATAVSINVTATEAEGLGYFTIWPCDADKPVASSINFDAGQNIANSVVVPIAADGTVCIQAGVSAADVVVDVTAWSASSEAYTPLVPARLLDTRAEQSPTVGTTIDGEARGQGVLMPGSQLVLPVVARGGVPEGTVAVAINVTVTEAAGPGYLTVWPCDADKPLASTINYADPRAIANSVVVPLSADGNLCIESGVTATHVVADVTGAFAESDEFGGLIPARLIDTRPETSPTSGVTVDGEQQGTGPLAAGSQVELQVTGRGGDGNVVPDDARTVALNLTSTGARGAGFLTAWPCDQERPTASSVNYLTADPVANSIIVALSAEGTVCIYAGVAATDVVADVTSYFK